MSLKQIIKRDKILKASKCANPAEIELILPGEPLIYCIKYKIGQRVNGLNFFRNMQWASMLKCFFRFYYKTTQPVVVLVKFYVTPPATVEVSSAELRRGKTPAVMAPEVCDYLLSFLEMLHKVLINSYRQVVKVDVEKYYSSDPRTVFKFMSWRDYVNMQASGTFNSKTERVGQVRKKRVLQSKRQGNDPDKAKCTEESKCHAIGGSSSAAVSGAAFSDASFPYTCTSINPRVYEEGEAWFSAHKKARRRQLGKISE